MTNRDQSGARARAPGAAPAFRVLLTTEATYPFHWGGLSTWCQALVRELPEIDFSLLAISDSPFAFPRFDRPSNLVEFRRVPLWGVRRAWELATPASHDVRGRRRRTTEAAVEHGFLPAYKVLLGQLLGEDGDDVALAGALHQIHRFCLDYDYDTAFRSRCVWNTLDSEVSEHFPPLAEALGYCETLVTLAELTSASQWIYHWLFPLSQPIPEVEVAHATMGGLCSMMAVVCKLEQGAGFLLSEHGIYLRECYLAEHASRGSLLGKVLKLAFARRMTELAYAYADAIAPCCDYNHRWEERIGVESRRIHTAYYGIDADLWPPAERAENDTPVVVWAGRIDPLKDVETLLTAAAVVKRARPDVRFLLYGAAPAGNERYHQRCLALRSELGLEETVSFEGFSSNTAEAFAEADLVVLSSISEGFPFSTLEAMLCRRAVVATAVGGISEQITPECGRLVRPRDPDALGAAILDVLADPKTCEALADAARERASSLFGIERFRTTHRAIYACVLEARKPRSRLSLADWLNTARYRSVASIVDGASPSATERQLERVAL